MSYGLTAQGFVIKRLIDIQEELQSEFKSVLGDGINLDDNAPLGQIIGIMAERESLIWELALSVYNSQYPDTAEGTSLKNSCALVGVRALDATNSTAVIRARGTVSTTIPDGRIVSVAGNSDVRFVTDSQGIIAAAVNAEQKITFSSVPDSGTWTITFDGETTAVLAFNENASTIETELENLSNITDVSVIGDYANGFTIEFINIDGDKQQPSFTVNNSLFTGATIVDETITVLDEGGSYIDIACTAEDKGANQAPSMTLTEIETLVAGWDEAYNLLDAQIGRDEETDEALRLRRDISLQQSRAGTVEAIRNDLQEIEDVVDVIVFENDDIVVDGNGRPAKSFEVVLDGGDDDAIANAIWNVKPAGIETFGTVSKTVYDSHGTAHTIYFSRPTDIDIYVEITVTKKNGATVTETQVKDAIIAYGDNLIFGDDIIVYPAFMAALNGLEIEDITLDIGTAPAPSGDDNIVIAPNEKARFDTSNITVTII
ncbi:MAG: hypothetical protein GY817_01170 [bacterium]|nr:hypothetical protein [bacterium]